MQESFSVFYRFLYQLHWTFSKFEMLKKSKLYCLSVYQCSFGAVTSIPFIHALSIFPCSWCSLFCVPGLPALPISTSWIGLLERRSHASPKCIQLLQLWRCNCESLWWKPMSLLNRYNIVDLKAGLAHSNEKRRRLLLQYKNRKNNVE